MMAFIRSKVREQVSGGGDFRGREGAALAE